MVDWTWKALAATLAAGEGTALQRPAQEQDISEGKIISTDPPYYDNIGYADLSDFFYVWMRRSLREIEPEIFGTIATPKGDELIATPFRHESREKAETFFLEGMTRAIRNLAERAHPAFPITIYYAFKATSTNAGWVTFLGAVLEGGLTITGTWPMRTELANRLVGNGTNSLASSIVLVCRKRPDDAPTTRWRDFLKELRQELPEALDDMTGKGGQSVPIAPVDLAQAAIGPGMAIFSRYSAVLRGNGSKVTVAEALEAIAQEVTGYFSPEGMAVDSETCFCHRWYQQSRWKVGKYADAQTLETVYQLNVEDLKNKGLLAVAERGEVQLRSWRDYADLGGLEEEETVWGMCHRLIAALESGGTAAAGKTLSAMRQAEGHLDEIRNLAYLLYQESEKGDTASALVYNNLSESWPQILERSRADREELALERKPVSETRRLEGMN